ncbi:hypothetical protein [Asticcacaulis biprosthecium]|nr:hypothetical protein [Asticcacaulis biprosthecium]
MAVNSVDGRFLFTAQSDKTIRIWDFYEGTQRTVRFKRDADVRAMAPVDGLQSVLVLSKDRVYIVDARQPYGEDETGDSRPLTGGTPFRLISTSPGGRFAILASEDQLFVRYADRLDRFRADEKLSSGEHNISLDGLKASALGVGGEMTALTVGTRDGTVHLIVNNRPEPALTHPMAGAIVKLAFDPTESVLFMLDAKGNLACFDMAERFRQNSSQDGRPFVVIAGGVKDFDVPRTISTGAMRVAATFEDGSVREFQQTGTKSTVLAERVLLEPGKSDDFGPVDARSVLFDYRDTAGIDRLFTFDRASGFIRYYRLPPSSPQADIVAALLPMNGWHGWMGFDQAHRYAGSALSLEAVARAVNKSIASEDFDPQRLDIKHRLRICGFLENLKYIEHYRPSNPTCVSDDAKGSVIQGIGLDQPAGGDTAVLRFRVELPGKTEDDIVVVNQGRVSAKASRDGCPTCFMATVQPAQENLILYVAVKVRENEFIRREFRQKVRYIPRKRHLYMVLIGVNDYAYHDRLVTPVSDVKRLFQQVGGDLRSAQDFQIEEVDLTQKPGEVWDPRKVGEALSGQGPSALKSQPNDIIWIILSGHGIGYSNEMLGQGKKNGEGDFYLIGPHAAESPRRQMLALRGDASPFAEKLLESGLLGANQIGAWLEQQQARHIVVTIDACYAGRATNSIAAAMANRFGKHGLAPLSGQVLVATSATAKAYDGRGNNPSPAMEALFSALTMFSKVEGDVSFRALFAEVKTRLEGTEARSFGTDLMLWSKPNRSLDREKPVQVTGRSAN